MLATSVYADITTTGSEGCVAFRASRKARPSTSGMADLKGRKVGDPISTSPPGTDIYADRQGHGRFAFGVEDDDTSRTWISDDAGKWTLVNDSSKTGTEMLPLAISKDGKTALIQMQRKSGTDIVERYDFATGTHTLVHENASSDPIRFVRSLDGKELLGARYQPTHPSVELWDTNHPDAQLVSDLHHVQPRRAVDAIVQAVELVRDLVHDQVEARLRLVQVRQDVGPVQHQRAAPEGLPRGMRVAFGNDAGAFVPAAQRGAERRGIHDHFLPTAQPTVVEVEHGPAAKHRDQQALVVVQLQLARGRDGFVAEEAAGEFAQARGARAVERTRPGHLGQRALPGVVGNFHRHGR